MKRQAGVILLALAAAAPLTTFAVTMKANGDDRFKPVTVGDTQIKVRDLLGVPNSITQREGQTHYVYNYIDAWGMRSVFDVAFDSKGRVAGKTELRVSY